jgi:hypothetical protein
MEGVKTPANAPNFFALSAILFLLGKVVNIDKFGKYQNTEVTVNDGESFVIQ